MPCFDGRRRTRLLDGLPTGSPLKLPAVRGPDGLPGDVACKGTKGENFS